MPRVTPALLVGMFILFLGSSMLADVVFGVFSLARLSLASVAMVGGACIMLVCWRAVRPRPTSVLGFYDLIDVARL